MKERTIKEKAFSSIVWKFLERIIAQGVSLIVSIIIARILIPEDYSVVSIVTIFFTFANVLISGGLNTSLIQKKEVDEYDYSAVLFMSLLLALFCYGVLFVCAPFIAKAYKQESVVLIMRVMGIALPINAVKSVICAAISRSLQFKKFFIATLSGTIVSAVIGITMALKGFGPWALVAQQLSNIFIDTVVLVLCTKIKIVFRISFSRLKELFSYGWKILFSSIIASVYTEINPLVIGLKFNASDLSFYTKGRSFPELFSAAANNTLSAVLFPILSANQQDKQVLLRYTRLFMRLASFIAFPVLLGLFAISDNFVIVLLTDKWASTSLYIKIFCLACLFDTVAVGNCETIKAMGRSDIYLIIEIIKKSLYFVTIGIFLFVAKTPEVVAISFIICGVIALIVNSVPNIKLLNYGIVEQIKDVFPNLITSIIMSVVVYYFGKINANKFLVLVMQVVLGIGIYTLINFIIKNESLFYIIRHIKSMLKKERRSLADE